jgi:hypothetical protein
VLHVRQKVAGTSGAHAPTGEAVSALARIPACPPSAGATSVGADDRFFPPDGARAYLRDLPEAELHLLDTGHFATATQSAEIAVLIADLGRRAHLRTQRRGPSAVVDFSCKAALSQSADVGAMRADMDPQLPRHPLAIAGGDGHAPVVAVLRASGQKRQTSPLLPPKGAAPDLCGPFPCKPPVFRGPWEGTVIVPLDP